MISNIYEIKEKGVKNTRSKSARYIKIARRNSNIQGAISQPKANSTIAEINRSESVKKALCF